MTKYWISVRAVSGQDFTSDIELGATRYLKVPDDEVPAPRHVIRMSQWTNEVIASFPPASPAGGGRPIPTGDIAFLVHGYNNGVGDVDRAWREVHDGLNANGFPCQVICFDWPS